MAEITKTLVLAGHYAGATVVLAGYGFKDGRMKLTGPEKDIDGVSRYLGKCYQAYMEDSSELREAQARDRDYALKLEVEAELEAEKKAEAQEERRLKVEARLKAEEERTNGERDVHESPESRDPGEVPSDAGSAGESTPETDAPADGKGHGSKTGTKELPAKR